MKVYVIMFSWCGDPPEVYEIYTRRELAEEEVKIMSNRDPTYEKYWIVEHDLIGE